MIKLNVQDYCQDCPHFSPDWSQFTHLDSNGLHGETVIFCSNEKGCQYAIEHACERKEVKQNECD